VRPEDETLLPDANEARPSETCSDRHPVMMASLLVIVGVPTGLWAARTLAFAPRTQLLTSDRDDSGHPLPGAPAVGWRVDRRRSH
jgi:hypothetical protein